VHREKDSSIRTAWLPLCSNALAKASNPSQFVFLAAVPVGNPKMRRCDEWKIITIRNRPPVSAWEVNIDVPSVNESRPHPVPLKGATEMRGIKNYAVRGVLGTATGGAGQEAPRESDCYR